jgi:hypothetical protein
MIKILSSRIFWGLILIIGGLMLLLDTLGIFDGGDLFWTVVTAVAAILFLSVFATNRDHWWALIPGTIFLALSAMIGLDAYLPGFSEKNLSSTILLGGIAMSFLLVYLVERSNWWAIIPMGVIATIAVVASMDINTSTVVTNGGVFFLGLGLTFILVAILPTPHGPMRWAWIPGIILGMIGLILLMAVEEYINYIWPIGLIIGGFLLVIRALRR